MKSHYKTITTALAAAMLFSGSVQAAYITFASTDRSASLGDASAVKTGAGNPGASDINALYPTGPWTNRGELTGEGSNGFLEVDLTTGSFGSSPIAGTWDITNPNYWSLYGRAVISIHVGGGNGEPDFWAWEITPGSLSGTWEYVDFDGRGGGLSNVKLWSSGTPNSDGGGRVPDGGTSIALLGVSLLGLGSARKMFKAKA